MTDEEFLRARAMMLRLCAEMSGNPLHRLLYRLHARRCERAAARGERARSGARKGKKGAKR